MSVRQRNRQEKSQETRSQPQTSEQAKLQRELADKIISYAPLNEIRILLACGAQVNEPVVQGLRPLHYAVYGKNKECVRLLLLRGSDANALDEVGYSALHLCAEHGNYELIELLIEHYAKVCFVDKQQRDLFPRAYKSEEPLRLAIKNGHYECARLLLENGADPNARYFLGAEISFVNPADIKFLKLLLMYGADPNVYDRDGLTPLMRACRNREGLDSASLLLEYGAYVNAYALQRQDLRTPLHYGILSGNLKMVHYLISMNARVNMRPDYDKPSPLDLAVMRDQPEMVQTLIDAGAHANAVYTYIGSPLHLACCTELTHQKEIVELLLEAGADPNLCPQIEDGRMKSPLVEYIRTQENPELAIVRLLLAYGGEVIMRSPLSTPKGMLRNLARLEHRPDLFYLLLDAGQEYCVPEIERISLSCRRRLEILDVASQPLSLQHAMRLAVRQNLNPVTPAKVAALPIPKLLKNYLLYK